MYEDEETGGGALGHHLLPFEWFLWIILREIQDIMNNDGFSGIKR